MKKQSLLIALLATIGFVGAAQAADGTVTFKGDLKATTCAVSGGTPGTGTGDFTVTMPTLQAATLPSAGVTAGSTAYNIYVGGPSDATCADGTKVGVHYEPNSAAVDPATGRLNVGRTGSNVQIQVSDAQTKTPINLATNTTSTPVTVVGNQATLPFTAEYYATGAATPGAIESSAQYSVTFN